MDPRLLMLCVFLLGCVKKGWCLEEGLDSEATYQPEPGSLAEKFLDSMPDNGDHGSRDMSDSLLGALLYSLLHTQQRPGRSPSFLFQPQRFGRSARGTLVNNEHVHTRGWDTSTPQFWSMAVPQRFGKKK
uniref:Pro-FMRFamide-related neuropeptide FF n=1 Tax=Geotrypetes seraphini TaxID=260995 RepID=A0A6P8R9U7_GEOSA|nr:pro-FMRFamide-related neuropeptide FF [Geotrypetes seraphini]